MKKEIIKIKNTLYAFLLFSSFLSAQEDSLFQLKLLFAGDIMQHLPQIKSAELISDQSYDYASCFKYLKPIIEQADLAIGNLEVTLPGKPPYQGYPQFRSPDDLALGLRQVGFDLLATANNHANDAGATGLINTINTLKNHGFYQTGTFKNLAERNFFYPLIIYKNNFKLCFLNYTYDTNGIKTKAPTVVNFIDTAIMKKDLALAKLIRPDFIIVIMHWGKEYHLEESAAQQKLAHWLFKNGADLIIGSHPHVVQPIKEFSNLNGSSKHLVVYSLGNFISNQSKPNTDGGLLVEIDLLKNIKSKQTTLKSHHYIPIWRYIQKDKRGKRSYFSIPISAFENGREHLINMPEKDIAAMKSFAHHIRTHLNNYDSAEKKVAIKTIFP